MASLMSIYIKEYATDLLPPLSRWTLFLHFPEQALLKMPKGCGKTRVGSLILGISYV